MNRNDPRQVHFPWEDNVERQILEYCIAVTVPGADGENGANRLHAPLGSLPAQIAEHPPGGVLIGIAAHDNFGEPRRTVYWLAISADMRGGYFLSGK